MTSKRCTLAHRLLARPLPLALSLLLSACGWVDSGVGGNAPPDVSAVQADYQVVAGGTLSVSAANGVLQKVYDGGNKPPTARLVGGKGPTHAAAFALHGDGSFQYTHDGSPSTADSFTFVANDGIDDSAPVAVSIGIVQPPQARPDTYDADYTPAAGVSLEVAPGNGVLANDSDPAGARLTASLETPAAIGSVALAGDGSFSYRETLPGRDTFSYRAGNGTAASEPVTVTIRIRPVAEDDAADTRSGASVDIDVLANDHDPDGTLQADGLAVVSAPAHGSAKPANGRVRYTPAAGFSGEDRFDYTVVDDDGATSQAGTVSVAVAADQPPRAQPIAAQQATVGSAFRLDGGGYFSDPDGDPLRFSAGALPAGLAIDPGSGVVSGVPEQAGTATVTLTASDGQASAESAFSLTVQAPALAPEQGGTSPVQPAGGGADAPAPKEPPKDKGPRDGPGKAKQDKGPGRVDKASRKRPDRPRRQAKNAPGGKRPGKAKGRRGGGATDGVALASR